MWQDIDRLFCFIASFEGRSPFFSSLKQHSQRFYYGPYCAQKAHVFRQTKSSFYGKGQETPARNTSQIDVRTMPRAHVISPGHHCLLRFLTSHCSFQLLRHYGFQVISPDDGFSYILHLES